MKRGKVSFKDVKIGDYVEMDVLDSACTWTKSLDPPSKIKLSRIQWRGKLVRKDRDIVVLDTGGTIEDENYARRTDYHAAWRPSVVNIKVIKRSKR